MNAVPPPDRTARLRDMQGRFPERVVRVENDIWRLRDTGGTGPVLVMLPGGLGNADIFYNQMLDLSRTMRCISVDYPEGPLDHVADGLAALLDILGLGCVSLLGSSLAGYWLQIFGVRHTSRVDAMILANSFSHSDDLRRHPLFDATMLRTIDGDMLKAEWLVRLKSREPDELRDVQISLLDHGQSGERLRQRLLAAATAPDAPRLPVGAFPLFLLDCDDDPLLPAPTRDALAERYPEAIRETLHGGGHYPSVAQATAYDSFILRAVPPC